MTDLPTRSMHVGGHYVTAADGSRIMVGQCHVYRHSTGRPGRLPIVLIHGSTQTSATFLETPDGRPGLAELLADEGHPVYLMDQPGIGRSRYYEPVHGPLTHFSAELLQWAFTGTADHDGWPQSRLHTQWPGTGRIGDPVFDAFYAGQVGHLADLAAAESAARTAGAALLDRIGPAHLLTHSQSGPLGWQIADARPDLVRTIVALEPKGPPYHDFTGTAPSGPILRPHGITTTALTYGRTPGDSADRAGSNDAVDSPDSTGPTDPIVLADSLGEPHEPHEPAEPGFDRRPDHGSNLGADQSPPRPLINLARIPVLLVTGEASYHANYDHLTADYLRRVGVPVTHARLADHGIHGNGHLMAMELNNRNIAQFVSRWILATAPADTDTDTADTALSLPAR